MALTMTQLLSGTTSGGTPSAVVYPCRIIGQPRRTIGLAGDNLTVVVKREEIIDEEPVAWPPADWDLTRPIFVTFGLAATLPDAEQTVTLRLYLQQDTPITFGVNDGTVGAIGGSGTTVAQERELLLTSALGVFQDGRGGRLRMQTYNPLDSEGNIDAGHADYREHSDLVLLCLDAMGFDAGYIEAAIDDEPPPGPLDWGNAHPGHELDGLLARIGYSAVVGYAETNVHIIRLPKAGEDQTPPSWITDADEPYTLTQARAVRGTTVIVTSGRTRTVEVTTRSLDDLEWVWKDPKTGRWLDDGETTALYPGTTLPSSLSAINAGPEGKTEAQQAEYQRALRAFRVSNAADFAATRRLVPLPVTGFDSESNQINKSAALVEAQGAIALPRVGFRNEPTSGAGLSRVDGVRVHPADGVFELPRHFVPARIAAGKSTSGPGDFTALTDEQFLVTFAYEANHGNIFDDYYVRGFNVTVVDDELVLTAITDDEELAAAIDDPMSVVLEAPWLRRAVHRDEADVVTPLNDTELNDAAEAIARVRAAGDLATTGVIEVRGILDKIPGVDWAWATSIAWDLQRVRTIVTVGSHEVPQGLFDALELDASRSFAAGLRRVSVPGSSAAIFDVRHGSSPLSVGGAP